MRRLFLALLLCPLAAFAQNADPNAPRFGQSHHGEVFNEGPRQRAYLMEGMPKISFPITTKDPEAQKFVEQGVGQLHGFWYYEAERSFRQAAALDANCAIAYWGMAMANVNNLKRAQGFIAEAVKRKAPASERERLYIDAWDAYCKADANKKKERAEAYVRALEQILYKFPDDLEARAFLALQLWVNRGEGVPISSYLAIDALLDQIFLANPLHPAHHYRIHLWDGEQAGKALKSAAVCGQTSVGIAHMWHMSGHIFSKLKRYDDAAWQQEASARVDHAHTMRDRILPDQIHNFAHNNEWLIRDLNHIGRVRDSITLAKNSIELPRHPKYNTLTRGSSNFGRLRLMETLSRFELWDEIIACCEGPYLEATDDWREQLKRLRWLGSAYYKVGNEPKGDAALNEVRSRLQAETEARDKAGAEAESKATMMAYVPAEIEKARAAAAEQAKADGKDEAGIEAAKVAAEEKTKAEQVAKKQADITKARDAAKQPFADKIKEWETGVNQLAGQQKAFQGDFKGAVELLKKAGNQEPMRFALLQFLAGDVDEAVKAAMKPLSGKTNEVQPLALATELLWRAEKKDEAKQAFEQLRAISGSIDMGSPVFERLTPIAKELGFPTDWRVKPPTANDVGDRPPLDSLGPYTWQPLPAPDFTLHDADGKPVAFKSFSGKPLVLIFFLGSGCLHCAEQLQKFGPMTNEYRAAGFELVAISTDNQDGLKTSIKNFNEEGKFPFQLLTDATFDAFKAYRVYDDFEKTPLHGVFVIDGGGRIRWHDVGFQPFQDAKFVLQEAKRLLSFDANR